MINFLYENIYNNWENKDKDKHFKENYSVTIDDSEENLDVVLYAFINTITAAGYYLESLDYIIEDYVAKKEDGYSFKDYLIDRIYE